MWREGQEAWRLSEPGTVIRMGLMQVSRMVVAGGHLQTSLLGWGWGRVVQKVSESRVSGSGRSNC